MTNWLHVGNSPFCDPVSKAQLYEAIKSVHTHKNKTSLVDKIMAAKGQTVLKLPPYRPDLCPIELIRADVKPVGWSKYE
jgi:transposase